MLIWPKEIVIWLCGVISCDGSIKYHKVQENSQRKSGSTESNFISLCYSTEIEWLRQIQKISRSYKIGVSLKGPYSQNSARIPSEYKKKAKEKYNLMLNKRYPKGRHGGLDQWQVFRNSIDHWGVQDYLMKRKYEVLCKITKPMPLAGEAKMQQSLR